VPAAAREMLVAGRGPQVQALGRGAAGRVYVAQAAGLGREKVRLAAGLCTGSAMWCRPDRRPSPACHLPMWR